LNKVGGNPRIAAIVLAAGRSSRMAPHNKLLHLIGGEKMIRCVAATALAGGARPVIVVTGHESQAVGAALHGLDLTVIVNPDYAQGLSTSLRAGLKALPPGIDGALILLGDMPEVEAPVLRALIAAFAGAQAICVPVHHGRRGNPLLWGSRYFAAMKDLTGDAGAKSLVTRYQDNLIEVEVASDGIFEDVDAPADLDRLNRSLAG
jgi:molybdenum cofactor cytidylyltransferase